MASSRFRATDGQASVELIAIVPALLVLVLIGAQLVLVGHSLWSAAIAARAGARAAAVGRSAPAAARRALPSALRRGAQVQAGPPVLVRVRVPRVIPGLPVLRVNARTALEPDAGG